MGRKRETNHSSTLSSSYLLSVGEFFWISGQCLSTQDQIKVAYTLFSCGKVFLPQNKQTLFLFPVLFHWVVLCVCYVSSLNCHALHAMFVHLHLISHQVCLNEDRCALLAGGGLLTWRRSTQQSTADSSELTRTRTHRRSWCPSISIKEVTAEPWLHLVVQMSNNHYICQPHGLSVHLYSILMPL